MQRLIVICPVEEQDGQHGAVPALPAEQGHGAVQPARDDVQPAVADKDVLHPTMGESDQVATEAEVDYYGQHFAPVELEEVEEEAELDGLPDQPQENPEPRERQARGQPRPQWAKFGAMNFGKVDSD